MHISHWTTILAALQRILHKFPLHIRNQQEVKQLLHFHPYLFGKL